MEDSDDSEIVIDKDETSEGSDSSQEAEEVESSKVTKVPLILDGTFFKIKSQQKNAKIEKVDNVLAQCILCKALIKGTLTATSNFLSHIKKKHIGDYTRYEEHKKRSYIPPAKKVTFKNATLNSSKNTPASSSTLQQHFKKSNQKIACEAIARYIVEANCPLRTVELPAFKDLISIVSKMGSEVSCPTRVTATKCIVTAVVDMKTKIIAEIKENKYFCTTADMWSAHRKSYIGVTLHFINDKLERKSYAIACKRFKGIHNYVTCGEMIQSIHQEYGLHSKNVTVTVTDNGSNLKKSFREFGMEKSLFEGVDSDDDSCDEEVEEDIYFENMTLLFEEIEEKGVDIELPFHHCCASHTLSLVATTDVANYCKTDKEFSKIYHPALAKCFGIWNLLKRSSSKANETAIESVGKNLKTPCPTRWNSLYDAICDLLKIDSVKINDLCTKLKLPLLLERQFDFLREYVQTIAPIAITLDKLQSDLNIGMGELIPCILNAVFKLDKIIHGVETKYCSKLAKMLIVSLKKRFDYVFEETVKSDHYILATVSNPAWKLNWCNSTQKERFRELFINELKTNNFSTSSISIADNEKGNSEQSNKDVEFYEFLEFNNQNVTPQQSFDTILNDYLSDQASNMPMLNRHPAIKNVFLKYNSGIPSSAPVERLFSFGSLVLTPRRCLLSDRNFENCLLLRANAHKV